MRLKNKVAIVTGGGMGIGEAIARRYATEGARIIVADMVAERGEAVASSIREKGGEAAFVQTDVSSEEQVARLADAAIARFDRIDILVNNAAVLLRGADGRAHELTNETWERTMNVNLKGYWLCAKYVVPAMLRQAGGSIIFLASRTGLRGFKGLAAYSASKGGVIALMRSMAVDYAPDHIRVNAIVPGTTDTPMNAEELSDPLARSRFEKKIPVGRLGVAADLAGLAVFLASDDAGFCIGGVYMADGGADVAA